MEGIQLLTTNPQSALESTAGLKVRSDPKTPVASTLADLHFVQHTPGRAALDIYLKKTNRKY